jgi:hypothetical protein
MDTGSTTRTSALGMGGGPRLSCQSRNDWIQASTSGMSIRHRLGRPQRGQLARVPAPREHRPGRPAVLLPAELDLLSGRQGRGRRGRHRPVPPRPPALGPSSRPGTAPVWSSSARAWAPSAPRRPWQHGTASLANLVAGSDGALFTGPTASNHIWDQFTDDREPRSPVWRPVDAGGASVQFANRPADLERPDQTWRHPRVLYVHHPSDPVRNATVEAF